MLFPIGKTNNNTLDPLWYNAQPFGTPTTYGFHEGEDYNLRTGGDSDLGQPLYAVANGVIRYYHNNSHPNSSFGRHMVLECETTRGKRWYHYAHCLEITAEVKTVVSGQQIGKLGKSGTTASHLHFSTFKVDPSTLYAGIDSIAANSTNLNNWWERFEILEDNETIVVKKKDWDRLYKASQLGDRLINGLHVAGNIADRSENDIDQIIAARNNAALQKKYDEGKAAGNVPPTKVVLYNQSNELLGNYVKV